MQAQRRAVLPDPGDELRGLEERVVGLVRHRAMARRSAYAKTRPLRALLRGDERQPRRASGEREAHAAELGHEEIGLDVVPRVLGEPRRAVGAERLLVGDRRVDERSLRTEPR